MKHITIQTPKGKRKIGPGEPTFIIAEMSGNHNHSFARAKKIIDASIRAGADAIKLQTYTADTLTMDSNNKYFQVKTGNSWNGETLYSLYKQAYTPWEWQKKLKEYAEKKGVMVFSTPFDNTAVDFLETLDVQLYKVSSFEIIDIPLLERIGKTKKPVIISRGAATASEITRALKTLRAAGSKDIAVLHCVSSYPADPKEMNLATVPDIARKFDVVSGLSDHTLGVSVSVAAVALGASIIEKHVTLRRSDGGPDGSFSLEPEELTDLVTSVREVEQAIGKPTYTITKEEKVISIFKKSIFVVKDIQKGDTFTAENIRVIRPGYGLEPKYYKSMIGKKARKAIKAGTPLTRALVI